MRIAPWLLVISALFLAAGPAEAAKRKPAGGAVAAAAPAHKWPSEIAGPIEALVVAVRDGDTVVARARLWFGIEITVAVRMRDADAPELKGKCAWEREQAIAARDFVAARLLNRMVVLRDIKPDKFGQRVDARVLIGGEPIAEAVIAAGLARFYDGEGKRAGWCPGPT